MQLFLKSMHYAAMVLFLCLSLGVGTAVAKGDETESYSLEKRIFIISKVYSAVNNYFAHWQDVPDLDLDALYQSYIERAINTEKRYEFDLLMMDFIGHLHNGHSWFKDAWLWRTYGQSLGFNFRYLRGMWVVTESVNPEIKPGDVIQGIDNEPFETFYQRNKKYTNPASERASRASFATYRFLFPRRFTIELSNRQIVNVERTLKFTPPLQIVDGKWIKQGEVAYIRARHLDGSDTEDKAIEYLKQYKNAAGLIIDLRGYAGGLTPTRLIDMLMDRPYRSWSEATNVNYGLFQFYSHAYEVFRDKLSGAELASLKSMSEYFSHSSLMWPATYQQPKEPIYKGKVIILIDWGCYSAKEDFIVPFKDNGRATLVGEKTAGSSGQPYFYNFDADLNLAIGTKREYFPDGSVFEGVGIAPDVEVAPTIQDIKAGRDPVLEKALAIADVVR